jgi:hypothetical protein
MKLGHLELPFSSVKSDPLSDTFESPALRRKTQRANSISFWEYGFHNALRSSLALIGQHKHKPDA